MFLVGALERFGNGFKLYSRLESDNRISSRFIAVERRHDLPDVRARFTLVLNWIFSRKKQIIFISLFFFSFARATAWFCLAQMYLCTLSLSIIFEGPWGSTNTPSSILKVKIIQTNPPLNACTPIGSFWRIPQSSSRIQKSELVIPPWGTSWLKKKSLWIISSTDKCPSRNKLHSSTFIAAKDPNWVLEWTRSNRWEIKIFAFGLFEWRSGALLQ